MTNFEEPPQTMRPSHPVVSALEAGTFQDLMEEALVPEEWRVETTNGFWWIPHRLRHDIEIVERQQNSDVSSWACRSTFLLCIDVEDTENALNMCDYLNQRGLGGAAWFDFDQKSIYFTTTTNLDPVSWFTAFIFSETVQRLVGQLENFAPTLADLVGGKVPDAVHPVHGRRSTPDQFLSESLLSTEQPEAACGLWWSPREIQAFRRALRFQLQQDGAFEVADQIDPDEYDEDATSPSNLNQEVIWTTPDSDSWTSLSVGEGRHPEYGFGLELILATSMLFGEDLGQDSIPKSDLGSKLVANTLNADQALTCAAPLGMGAWMTWRGQLVHETFLYPQVVAKLQYLAGEFVGEVIALMAGMCGHHLSTLWETLDDICLFAGKPTNVSDRRWSGVVQNAGLHPMFGSCDELFRNVYSTYPLNQLIEPMELDEDGFKLATQPTFASMGIFNPIGPTVGSIELAINYRLGAALLLERVRHPLYPSVRVHAVLDESGFAKVDRLLEELIGQLQWSTFDWFDTKHSSEKDVAAMRRGLRAFAQAQPDEDHARNALALVETLNDPWFRVEQGFEPSSAAASDADPIELWINVISHAANIDNHCAFIRSAWEGAAAYSSGLRQGSADAAAREAQAATDFFRMNTWDRKEPPPRLPN